jgi:hypothetical protein
MGEIRGYDGDGQESIRAARELRLDRSDVGRFATVPAPGAARRIMLRPADRFRRNLPARAGLTALSRGAE